MPRKGAFALIQKNQKVLLVRYPNWVERYPLCWGLPGGFIDEGEGIEEGLLREVVEETGLEVKIKDKFHEKGLGDLSLYFYVCEYVGGEVTFQKSELNDARWFSLEELDQVDFTFDTKEILKKGLNF